MKRPWLELSESCRIAWEQIYAHRLRSFLTALGVIIGIIAVTLMGTAIRGIGRGVDRSFAIFGDDVLYVTQWPWRDVHDWWNYINRRPIQVTSAARLNELIAQTPGSLLELAVPADSLFSNVKRGDSQVNFIFTLGASADQARISASEMKEGRWFSEVEDRGARQVCVVGFDVAEALFPNESPLGKKVRVRGQNFEVIGVVARQGSFLGLWSWDSMVGVPLGAFRKFFANNANPELRVKVKDKSRLAEAREELTGHMRRIRGLGPEQKNDFEINDQGGVQSQLDPITNGIALAGIFITGLALFVGAIGIMNITFVSVKERTREIGTRKALGARRKTILLQFLVEAVSVCLLGGLVGLAIAWGLCAAAAWAFPSFPISFSVGLVFVGLGLSVITGVLSGFVPAWQASRLDPVEALRYE